MIGIYTITNSINGKIYVGYSKNIKSRLYKHKYELRNNTHKNKYLQNAYDLNGEKFFKFETLLECNENHLASEEHYWCNILNVHNKKYGYNLRPTHPDNIQLFSEETRKKMSESAKGKIISLETRERLSKAFKGRKHSEESKKKMSKSQKGRITSDETKIKLRLAKKIKPQKGHSKNIKWTLEKREERSIKYSKRIINIETGEIYLNALELSKIIDIPSSTIAGKMSGRLKNKTNYMYLTDYISKEKAIDILFHDTLMPF